MQWTIVPAGVAAHPCSRALMHVQHVYMHTLGLVCNLAPVALALYHVACHTLNLYDDTTTPLTGKLCNEPEQYMQGMWKYLR